MRRTPINIWAKETAEARRELSEARDAALEEAAEVAEADNNHCGKRIAAAIRVLKDKP